ncbi:hypothetical protein [Blastochloris viridis]|uniref:Uncharacterized protein n=1 Tax=Blastochloris viridis TaxID=1079 RepID=A0A0H5B969_BLAVI|nr:hypothetical protein [Blastochloris viridis]ALK07984.1 hypothetical protein BVIR_168 [Blastochloris viridis]BAR98760.1 hypothetical protein BV133_1167 [Blastochloris viridis]CUU43906.1 hypothetical protein BVIRIDIS_29340 [Blastochloris viridis]
MPADLVPEPQLEDALVGAVAPVASLTGDSRLDAEVEAAFAEADRSFEAIGADDDIIAIDRPFEDEVMIEAADAPPLAPSAEPPGGELAGEIEPGPQQGAARKAPAVELRDDDETASLEAVAADSAAAADSAEPVRPRRRALVERPRPWTRAMHIATTAVVAMVAAALIWRSDLVRLSPSLGGFFQALGMPVNLRGLEFHEVKAVRDVKDGIPVLSVEGYVFNPGPKAAEISKLRMAVVGPNGRELYAWTAEPAQPMLSAGESFMMRSRLASPPQDGQEVLVRFLLKRDLVNAKP